MQDYLGDEEFDRWILQQTKDYLLTKMALGYAPMYRHLTA
jgi:hypothetical protein